jgi:hypothetical protein
MDRREKLEFLLEQMRLCLAKYDYIRTQIISKKINIKAFEDETSHVNSAINSQPMSISLYSLGSKIKILSINDRNGFTR